MGDNSLSLPQTDEKATPAWDGEEHRKGCGSHSRGGVMHGWIGAQHVTWWPTYTTGEPRREEEEHAAEHPPPGSGAPSAGDLREGLHPAPCNEADREETPPAQQPRK